MHDTTSILIPWQTLQTAATISQDYASQDVASLGTAMGFLCICMAWWLVELLSEGLAKDVSLLTRQSRSKGKRNSCTCMEPGHMA
jgi:hypothetical protein